MKKYPSVIPLVLLLCFVVGCQDKAAMAELEEFKAQAAVEQAGVIYRNPQVYNVDYSFELFPDPQKIDRTKDLKLWIPVPREWDSQKEVKIISVQPPSHAEYEDPEQGNRMLFWDFGKEPEKPSYRVDIKFRLESYGVHTEVNPEHIGSYDKKSKEYALYTRSTHTVSITPKIREMALEAVRDEKNPYRQAEELFKFVRKNMRYTLHRLERGVGTEVLLTFPYQDEITGEEYYEGACGQYSAFFIALCRSVGIPARAVVGFVGGKRGMKEEDLELYKPIELNLSPEKLAGTQHYLSISPHVWAEFYLAGYGWVPVDPTTGRFGQKGNRKVIMSKGFDPQLGPHSPGKESEGYGFQWVLLHNGMPDLLQSGVWNIAKIRMGKVTMLHHSDPFPADGYAEYATNLYPESEEKEKLISWRKDFLLSILLYSLGYEDQNKNDPFTNNHRLNSTRQAYLCHLLRQTTGKENFSKIFKKYLNLRLTTGNPVSTAEFQGITESIHESSLDFFFNKLIYSTSLSELKLDSIINKLSELIRLKDINLAINSYRQLRNRNPDDYDFSREQLDGLGFDLRDRNMFDESITIYKWIIGLYPDWWDAYNGIADVYRLKGDKEQAIKNYAKSLELFPDIEYAREIIRYLKELTEQNK